MRDENGEILAMAQVLYRKYKFSIGIVYCGAGPACLIENLSDELYINWINDLQKTVTSTIGLKFAYMRLFSYLDDSNKLRKLLHNNSWEPCKYKRFSGQTMKLDLSLPIDQLYKNLSKNWRHNLKRSKKYKLQISRWDNPDPKKIREIYASLEKIKGLREVYSVDELTSMFEAFGDSITVYQCHTANDELVSLRGCVSSGNSGWDWFAATTETGRKNYASYALCWALLKHCNEVGIKYYDFMGADPDSNPGVYNFKKGTGALFTKYLGEWEWSNNLLYKWLVNFAIRRTRSRSQIAN